MNSKGFSMIETLVALVILVVIGSAIISLVLTMVSANISAKRRNQAIAFAEEGVEQGRDYFQTNGFQSLYGKASSSGTCYPDGKLTAGSSFSCPAPPDCATGQIPNSLFYRFVKLTQGTSLVKVESVVSWLDKGVCRNTQVDTYFYSY